MRNIKKEVPADACNDEKTCSCCAVDFFEERPPFWKRRKLIAGSVAGIFLVSGLIVNFLTPLNIVAQILYIMVIAVAGKDILLKAGRSLLKRRLDMNCLMSLAAFGAFFIGHGEEGAAVIFLFFVAESLEEYAADNVKKSMSQLLSLAPETVKVMKNGREMEMHTHDVEVSEIFVVRPGEKVPLDGRVVTGHSSINESPITGESIPVEKSEGERVYAGTLNEEGYLEVEVTGKSEDTVLSRIVKLVEEAEGKKSKTEKFIDKFARFYTPSVIGLSFATFIVPTFLLGSAWDTWFYRALVLLVVSCPCALAISTPVAMVSAITSAARHGVLIKGAAFIEELNKTHVFAFDKTGTLTRGKLEVTDIVGFNNHSKNGVLSIAASLESRSEHPLAKAITEHAAVNGVQLKEIIDFKSIKGKGLRGGIDGKIYYAGAKKLFDDLSIKVPEELFRFEAEGKTSIFISNEDTAIGVIALGDIVRKKASKIISDLKTLNIRTWMLTGDNKKVACSLADNIGIDEYDAELLPEDKVEVIDRLADKFGRVAMVGDGVNDAPALAAAGVGIAMGTVGSDVAIETADIALMHDDLSRIEYLMLLCRKTMDVVKQNVTASILVKGSFTFLALAGLINLWIAVGIGDMGLSLAVILNALRLTRVKA